MGILKRQPFKQEQATLLHIYRSRHICGNWKKRKKGLAFLLVKNSTWAKLNSNMYKEKKKKLSSPTRKNFIGQTACRLVLFLSSATSLEVFCLQSQLLLHPRATNKTCLICRHNKSDYYSFFPWMAKVPAPASQKGWLIRNHQQIPPHVPSLCDSKLGRAGRLQSHSAINRAAQHRQRIVSIEPSAISSHKPHI